MLNKFAENADDNRIIEGLKEIFKPQNCVIYIIAFLVSMVTIQNTILPFGLAMIAGCVGSAVPVFVVYVIVLLSTAIFHGGSLFAEVFFTSLIFMVLTYLFKTKIFLDDRNEVFKVGSRMFFANLIYNYVRIIRSGATSKELFLALVYASFLYVFYKIFVNGIALIRDYMGKDAFTIEEAIAASIIFVLAISCLNTIKLFNAVTITSMLTICIIIYLALKYGPVVGITSSLSLGIILLLVGNFNPKEIGLFTIVGVIARNLS